MSSNLQNIDSLTWGCILHIKPFISREQIKRWRWINEWDLFIEFTNGEKYIYDNYTKYFRYITYDRTTINEKQFRLEFRDRLNSMMQRKGITQEMLAEFIGTSQQMISRYCRGDAMPSQFIIHKMALLLECEDYELLYQEY